MRFGLTTLTQVFLRLQYNQAVCAEYRPQIWDLRQRSCTTLLECTHGTNHALMHRNKPNGTHAEKNHNRHTEENCPVMDRCHTGVNSVGSQETHQHVDNCLYHIPWKGDYVFKRVFLRNVVSAKNEQPDWKQHQPKRNPKHPTVTPHQAPATDELRPTCHDRRMCNTSSQTRRLRLRRNVCALPCT